MLLKVVSSCEFSPPLTETKVKLFETASGANFVKNASRSAYFAYWFR